MALTKIQREAVIACAWSHINRFIEARDGKAIAAKQARGWLRDRVITIARRK